MTFSVISEQDVIAKFRKAENKKVMLQVLADLTVSSEEEIAKFVGVKLIKKYPWVIEA